jgi:hypothetical protein
MKNIKQIREILKQHEMDYITDENIKLAKDASDLKTAVWEAYIECTQEDEGMALDRAIGEIEDTQE